MAPAESEQTRAQVAAHFYRGDCAAQIDLFLRDFTPPRLCGAPIGGIVPHAGWSYSGRTAARVFETLRATANPEALVLLGAMHRHHVDAPAIYPEGAWATPLGPVPIDHELATLILAQARGGVRASKSAHSDEHSIEVQLPMIRHLMPETRVVPIAVPPTLAALNLGATLASVVAHRPGTVVVASTDLTHYGAPYGYAPAGTGEAGLRYLEENDRRIITRALELDAGGLLREAARHHNACGAGAFAAAVEFARRRGAASGHVLEYTTSHAASPETEFEMGVGYVAMVFAPGRRPTSNSTKSISATPPR